MTVTAEPRAWVAYETVGDTYEAVVEPPSPEAILAALARVIHRDAQVRLWWQRLTCNGAVLCQGELRQLAACHEIRAALSLVLTAEQAAALHDELDERYEPARCEIPGCWSYEHSTEEHRG